MEKGKQLLVWMGVGI